MCVYPRKTHLAACPLGRDHCLESLPHLGQCEPRPQRVQSYQALTLASETCSEVDHHNNSAHDHGSRSRFLEVEKFGVLFGYPISRSCSPLIHHTVDDALNLHWQQVLLESTNMTQFPDLMHHLKVYHPLSLRTVIACTVAIVQERSIMTPRQSSEYDQVNQTRATAL